MVFAVVLVGIIASSVWVLIDADAHEVPLSRAKSYSAGNGSVTWFIACLLLWIVGFPWYLVSRSAVGAARQSAPAAAIAASPPPWQAAPSPPTGTGLSRGWVAVVAVLLVAMVSIGVLALAHVVKTSTSQLSASTGASTNPSQAATPAVAATSAIQAVTPTAGATGSQGPQTPSTPDQSSAANDETQSAMEGLHSLQVGVQNYAVDHGDQYPNPSFVTATALVDPSGTPYVDTWPTNPYTGQPMAQDSSPGDFTYATDGTSFQMSVYGPSGDFLLTVP